MRVFRTADRADAQALADAMSAKQGLPKVSRRADGRPSPHAREAQAYLDGDRTGPPAKGLTLGWQPGRAERAEGDEGPDEWEVPVLDRDKADIVGLRFKGRTLRDADLEAPRRRRAERTREIEAEERTR